LHGRLANRNTIVAAEKKFQFLLNGRKIKGSIDRIEQTPEGDYVVTDFKTGSKPSSLTKNSVGSNIQLNLYSLAIKEMFGKLPKRASFFYIRTTSWSIISRPKRPSASVQKTPNPSSPQSVRNDSIRLARTRRAGSAIMGTCAG
jgi:hypothetical protein